MGGSKALQVADRLVDRAASLAVIAFGQQQPAPQHLYEHFAQTVFVLRVGIGLPALDRFEQSLTRFTEPTKLNEGPTDRLDVSVPQNLELLLRGERPRGGKRTVVQIEGALRIGFPQNIAQLAVTRGQIEARLSIVIVHCDPELADANRAFVERGRSRRVVQVRPIESAVHIPGPDKSNGQRSAIGAQGTLFGAWRCVSDKVLEVVCGAIQVASRRSRPSHAFPKNADLIRKRRIAIVGRAQLEE